MGKTKTFTVTDAADVAVVAQICTPAITVQEDPGVASWPTQNFTIKKPTSGDVAIQRPIGGSYTFAKATSYVPGEIAGYVRLVNASTSTTFQQDES